MRPLEAADEAYATEKYGEAAQHYLEAMQQGDCTDAVSDRWVTCIGFRVIEDARSVVRAHPRSSAARRLLFLVLMREHEYAAAVRVASEAIGTLQGDDKERMRFVNYRLDAALRGARLHVVDWQQVRRDLSEVWRTHAQTAAEGRHKAVSKLQAALVRRLLGIMSEPAAQALREFAADIDRSHADYARALRSHATTIELFTQAQSRYFTGDGGRTR